MALLLVPRLLNSGYPGQPLNIRQRVLNGSKEHQETRQGAGWVSMGKRGRDSSGGGDALVFDQDAQQNGTRPVGALAKRKQKRKGVEIQFDPQAHK